ncbi:MAG: prolyl oligopeptidase family serine peptidase [Phycisphaerales bacterium]
MVCTRRLRLAAFLAAAAGLVLPALAQQGGGQKLTYPPAPTVEQTDVYHGTTVADPYRWLESYTDDTNAWIEAQNKVTFAWLESIPERAAIKARLTQLWDYEKYSAPYREGGRYFFSKNDGLQNQSVFYTTETLDGQARVLIDPNALSEDGTVALAGASVTDDGRLVAYGVAEAGSDWNTWRVRDVATGKDLPDEVRWVKFAGASWMKDGKGFFYSRFDEPKADGDRLKGKNEYHKVYFHTLGTPQSEDRLVYDRPDHANWYLGGGVTDDGKYLVIGVNPGDKIENNLYYRELSGPDAPVVKLLDKLDAQYSFIDNDGPTFWVQSDLEAPRGRVWAIDITRPERENWKEVIPQQAEALQGVSVVGDRFFASYLKDARTQVRVFDLSGKPIGEVAFPGIGTASGFRGKRADKETFYTFSSYTIAPTVFRYDVASGKSSIHKAPKMPFNSGDYETVQKFYTSKDGTKVPMFISHRKGLKLDGSNPTLLYGYGGFNVPITPGFSPVSLAWMEMGGVYAVANIRGGSEYGEEWHQAGMRLKKQNVFDDFIAGAEWLIENRYTSPKKLAIQGGSNGGLLVGACLNQRPELFGAAIPQVGVMDMLRFHEFTVGWGWIGDYGSAKDPAEFRALQAYSPYHNIRDGVCYPPTLITTADHDDRVYPAHSFKYAARLQAAQGKVEGCTNPTLIRIEVRAGHGAGKPTSKRIEEAADLWSFLVKSLNMKVQGPAASMGGGNGGGN